MGIHSQKQMKIVTNDMLPVVDMWRHVTSYAQRNDVGQNLKGCISGSNGPILILFIENCSWKLLD